MKRVYRNGSNKLDDAAVIASRKETYSIYLANRKDKLERMINECLQAEDNKKTKVLRENGNIENYLVFLDVCLIHFVESAIWKYKCYSNTVSETFSVSDEAMAMLIFENHLDDFQKIIATGQKVSRKFACPKFTKSTNDSTKFHGWHISGVKRFNELVKFVKEHKASEESRQMEDDVKHYYKSFCNRRNVVTAADNEAANEYNNLEDNETYEEAIDDWAEL